VKFHGQKKGRGFYFSAIVFTPFVSLCIFYLFLYLVYQVFLKNIHLPKNYSNKGNSLRNILLVPPFNICTTLAKDIAEFISKCIWNWSFWILNFSIHKLFLSAAWDNSSFNLDEYLRNAFLWYFGIHTYNISICALYENLSNISFLSPFRLW